MPEGYSAKSRLLTELYSGKEGYTGDDAGTKIEQEVIADLVGDYLFTDADFINSLSVNHRNVFEKIYDEIKYLCKTATAGSEQAKKLEEVKKLFAEAYRAETKNTTREDGVRYALSETTDGRIVAVVENDILEKIDTTVWDKPTKEKAQKAASNALKQFSGGIVVNGITRKVNRVSRNEFTRSDSTEKLYRKTPDIFADKMRAADVADDIVIAATGWNRDGGLKHPRADNFVDFDHVTTLIMSGDAKYIAEVVVGITNSGEAVFYDVVDMTPTEFDIKNEETPTIATTQNAIGDIQGDSSTKNISPPAEKVKRKISSLSQEEHKSKQLDIILESNPANNEYSTWIRDVSDIKTFEETLQDSDWDGWEEGGFDPDYTPNMVKQALESGKITVFSSYPIEQGIFVTPSRMEAQSYSSDGKVYSKTVALEDVAWIDPTQGQYAKVNDGTKASLSEAGTDDLAPVTPIGTYNVYGKDIALEDDLAPLPEATKAISKSLGEYPTEKREMIKSYLHAVDAKIKNFVQKVKAGDLTFKREKISDLSERATEDINELLGLDVNGYSHNINTNGIQHIITRHGENGKHDSSMAVDDDIARIGWVLENYDRVELLKDDGNQRYSSGFMDGDNSPAPQVRFIKKIDGTYYVVEAIFENGYKKLWVQSAYLQKNEDVTQAPAEGNYTNHEANAQSALASPSSDSIIAGDAQFVNRDDFAPLPEATKAEAQQAIDDDLAPTSTIDWDDILDAELKQAEVTNIKQKIAMFSVASTCILQCFVVYSY